MSRFDQLDLSDYEIPAATMERLLSPALVIFMNGVRENLRRLLAHMNDDPDRWRPHIKTTKTPEVLDELLKVGIRNFKCATLREARVLLELVERRQLPDVDLLVAYPLVGPALEELGELAQRHARVRVSLLCEQSDGIDTVPEQLSLFVDINPGMNRTGIPLDRTASIVETARRAGARFRGLHFYDGQLTGSGSERRRRAAFRGYNRLVARVELLRSEGIPVPEIITSGTPTFLHALDYPGFAELSGIPHRVSPGTAVFHDLRSEQEIEELDLVPAALVFSRVVSQPATDIVTCDAGSKSVAAEAGDPCALVLGHPELTALEPSEEHLPLHVVTGPAPERGQPLLLFPRHVCPTVNLAEQALLIEDGHSRMVSVAARAHDLFRP